MEQRIMMVKSNEDNYFIEEKDIKNNTTRFTNDWNKIRWDEYYDATHIQVYLNKTKKNFIRKIRHKCTYRTLAIITWHPNS